MELYSPKKVYYVLIKTPLGETGCYDLLAAQASSFLINPLFPNTVTLGILHLTLQPLRDLRDGMPSHWSLSASHPTVV